MATAPDDWARAFNVSVVAGQVTGRTPGAKSASFTSGHAHPDLFDAHTRMLLEKIRSHFAGSLARIEVAQGLRPEQPNNERELRLYKEELKKLRSEQNDQDRQARKKRKGASAYLDEAIALAHPVALPLLAWLHVRGRLDLGHVFEALGASSSTFEGIARLHLMGVLKFNDGELTMTSLGQRVLEKLGLVDAEGIGGPESSVSA